jgi:D-aminopeptidase
MPEKLRNLITDVLGLAVGNSHDAALASGVTALVFETPAACSIAVHGGAPGLRDTALLEPDMMVDAIDALVFSGGSAFGLDAMGGVQAALRQAGRGLEIGTARVPIVPGAILFDLLNGGDKGWRHRPPYWDLGYEAANSASNLFDLGTAGAGYGATTATLKGGLGSASTMTRAGYRVGALVAVNAVGQATIGSGPHFWAAPFEREAEFGGLGLPSPLPADALRIRLKGQTPSNTTLAIVATDAPMSKSELKRLAVQAHDGLALALRPAHCASDGDVVFAASTARNAGSPKREDRSEIAISAVEVVARAIARGIHEASSLPFPGAIASWKDVFSP